MILTYGTMSMHIIVKWRDSKKEYFYSSVNIVISLIVRVCFLAAPLIVRPAEVAGVASIEAWRPSRAR